jgi:hypothetical protein
MTALQDSTLEVVRSLDWLFIGLFFYLLFTLLKVHLIVFVQRKVYANMLPDENPLQGYFTMLYSDMRSGRELYRLTRRFLFKYNEAEWREPENKKIKAALNILNGVTVFLKPYLLVACAYTLLRGWISFRFFYDELTITLGSIQKVLAELSSFGLIAFLKDNKALILLIYGATCVSIPFLYERQATTKALRKYFTHTLVYLSIILNISFFGSGLGSAVAEKSDDLARLKMEVIETHEKIYSGLAKAIIMEDFEAELTEKSDEMYRDFHNLNFEARGVINRDNDSLLLIAVTFRQNTINWLYSLERSIVLPSITREPPEQRDVAKETVVNRVEENPTYQTIRRFQKKEAPAQHLANPITETSTQEYIVNDQQWNKKNGNELFQDIEEIFPTNTSGTDKSVKKIEILVGNVVDFGIDKTASEFLELFGLSSHKILKKFIELILSERYKKSLSDRIVNFASRVKAGTVKAAFASLKRDGSVLLTKDDLKKINDENHTEWKRIKQSAKEENQRLIHEAELRIQNIREADENLAFLSRNSRWERIRENALEAADYYDGFTYSQKGTFKEFLKAWINHRDANKMKLVSANVAALEELFFDFIRNEPMYKACWGFILQQEDFNSVRAYYAIHPDSRATGRPYYILKYYLGATNRLSRFQDYVGEGLNSFYDGETNEAVDEQCPH